MEETQRAKGSRAAYRAHVTRIFKKVDENLETETPLTDTQVAKLTSNLEQLTQKKDTLQQLNGQIASSIQTSEELETEILEAEEIQDTIIEYMSLIKHRLEKTREPARTLSVTAPEFVPTLPPPVTREPVSRLPKLSLPHFSGDTLMWQVFKDSFDAAVHNSPSLSKVQKFNYLRAQLQGDALRAIAGLQLTDANYDHAIALLTQRYGQSHKIEQAHMQALSQTNCPTSSLSSLQLFYDTIEAHIRGLTALGKTEDSYESMLVPIILGKLPSDVHKNLVREHGVGAWTIAELRDAIWKEITILECGSLSNKCKTMEPYQSTMTTTLHTGASGRQSQPANSGTSKNTCVFCKGPHFCGRCDVVKDPQKRFELVKKGKHCFNCLGHHRASQCPSKLRCKLCRQKHHTSLCGAFTKPSESNTTPVTTQASITTERVQPHTSVQPQTTVQPQSTVQSQTTETTTPSSTAMNAAIIPPEPATRTNSMCLLKTAVAQVSVNGIRVEAHILFDEGAQRSFMSNQLAKKLMISPQQTEHINISTFGGEPTLTKQLDNATVNVETLTGESIPISVLLVPVIAAPLQNRYHTHLINIEHLQGLQLANPVSTSSNFYISLLIGADYYWQFVGDHIVRGNGPTAMQSKLGYLLSGPLVVPPAPTTNASMFHVSTPATDCNNAPTFWMMESANVTQPETAEVENEFLERYQQSCIRREEDGAYRVKFPWKQEYPPLPSNYAVCKNKTRSLARKLSHTPELLHLYGKIIMEQEQRGFIEKVTAPDLTKDVHYIPHHPVSKASSTTPIRIVYNCSYRQARHPSLNDCLLTGPSFTTDMCSILLRFRSHAIGISTDLEKAFLHVRLDESDRDNTRFFWLSSPSDPESDLEIYRFKTVLFGSTSSPFMLMATLHHHLNSWDSPVAQDMKQNLYVDNVISGCSTEAEAIKYYREARFIMTQAQFNLRSWASNSSQLQAVTVAEGTADCDVTVNLLGLLWNTATDTISFTPKQFLSNTEVPLPVTKRLVLQLSSKVYDPLGILSPVTIQAKILMQDLWRSGIAWDDPLFPEHTNRWWKIAEDLQDTSKITIPRFYFGPTYSQPVELHVFADASMKAYGAIAFLRTGEHTCFVLARSRVVPLKPHTLPRLELMAAVVASRLAQFVVSSLPHLLQKYAVKLWSDSQIVLHWLYSKKRLKQFISNRVQEINKTFPDIPWLYCPTNDNPADLLTRGLSAAQLNSSCLWQQGPPWLTDETRWPAWNHSEILHLQVDDDVMETNTSATDLPNTVTSGIHNLIELTKYSSLMKVLRVSAHVYRFVHNTRNPTKRHIGPLSVDETNKALTLWIHSCQHTTFHKEILNIRAKRGKRLPLVRQLRLFMDSSDYLRCGGRIHNAHVDSDTKFPILLPKHHPLTKLIVLAVHKEQLHAGVTGTVTSIRQGYWIPSARQLVRQLIRKCVSCRKVSGKPYMVPEPPPLPLDRVKEGKPFDVTGVDFTGALHVKNNGTEEKVYICLFTCGLSRAVHLEVVCDLSVETFLRAFRRFVSRKSLPQVMISDNASTYVSASKELEQIFTSDKLGKSLNAKGVRWKFIPKRAPWYGGFWERLIGITKTVLRKVLGKSFITLEVLQTLIVEVEAVLNDRPLTYLSADVTDPEPLTPSHLLYGRRMTMLPYPAVEEEQHDPTFLSSTSLRDKVNRQTLLLNHFQRRWQREYLTSLREAYKATGTSKQSVKVGDVVLVHDDIPRLQWRLAVIEELMEGLDGYARAAKIRTSTGRTNRPIAKLYPLELSSPCEPTTCDDNRDTDKDNDHDVSSEPVHQRPTRDAAARARVRIKSWTNQLTVAPEDVDD
ncbi:uncharacterized protein [Dysidea avara]|uniref:uncharacterized protein n=1 Tax=Dysidea avara TaxID=196820 RepID=UPI00332B9BAA